jgi:hypothetical protein
MRRSHHHALSGGENAALSPTTSRSVGFGHDWVKVAQPVSGHVADLKCCADA